MKITSIILQRLQYKSSTINTRTYMEAGAQKTFTQMTCRIKFNLITTSIPALTEISRRHKYIQRGRKRQQKTYTRSGIFQTKVRIRETFIARL